MKKIPPSSSLTWCKWGESLTLHVILILVSGGEEHGCSRRGCKQKEEMEIRCGRGDAKIRKREMIRS